MGTAASRGCLNVSWITTSAVASASSASPMAPLTPRAVLSGQPSCRVGARGRARRREAARACARLVEDKVGGPRVRRDAAYDAQPEHARPCEVVDRAPAAYEQAAILGTAGRGTDHDVRQSTTPVERCTRLDSWGYAPVRDQMIENVRRWIDAAERGVALTGAGAS